MSGIRAWRRRLMTLALLTTPIAAMAQPAPAEPGSELVVYLMTMGPGDAIWERFGHNGIGIRDTLAGTDVVYNWGVFDFTEADFLPRFIRGEMRYRVEPWDASLTVDAYRRANRSVEVQYLALTPAERLALRRFVEWNALDENKYYRYDYFLDNCSTRARNALDEALGGRIRAQFAPVPSGMSFRDEARRLADADPLYPGIDVGLGTPSDREMSRHEALFIPMRLRDAMREMTLADSSGGVRPLVVREEVLVESTRPPELAAPRDRRLVFALVGVALAGLMALLARLAPRAERILASSWSVLSGVVGLLLAILWGLTAHVWAWNNVNLLLFHPLWFVVAVIAARRLSPGPRGRGLLLLCGGLAIVGGALGILRWPQDAAQVALLALAPHAWVLGTRLRRAHA